MDIPEAVFLLPRQCGPGPTGAGTGFSERRIFSCSWS